jgi:hypothetical protein
VPTKNNGQVFVQSNMIRYKLVLFLITLSLLAILTLSIMFIIQEASARSGFKANTYNWPEIIKKYNNFTKPEVNIFVHQNEGWTPREDPRTNYAFASPGPSRLESSSQTFANVLALLSNTSNKSSIAHPYATK